MAPVEERPGPRAARRALAGEFLIGYAGARMVAEVFREPDASLILGLSRGTFYSLVHDCLRVASKASPAGPLLALPPGKS